MGCLECVKSLDAVKRLFGWCVEGVWRVWALWGVCGHTDWIV